MDGNTFFSLPFTLISKTLCVLCYSPVLKQETLLILFFVRIYLPKYNNSKM